MDEWWLNAPIADSSLSRGERYYEHAFLAKQYIWLGVGWHSLWRVCAINSHQTARIWHHLADFVDITSKFGLVLLFLGLCVGNFRIIISEKRVHGCLKKGHYITLGCRKYKLRESNYTGSRISPKHEKTKQQHKWRSIQTKSQRNKLWFHPQRSSSKWL